MATQAPRGRKRNVTGTGSGVHVGGSGLGTGPVGSSGGKMGGGGSGRTGHTGGSYSGGSGGGGSFYSGGGSSGGSRGSGGGFGLLPILIIIAIVFFGVFEISRFVSLGSIITSVAIPVFMLIFHWGEWWEFLITVIYCLLTVWSHRSNIKRLISGTENAFPRKKKKEEQAS